MRKLKISGFEIPQNKTSFSDQNHRFQNIL